MTYTVYTTGRRPQELCSGENIETLTRAKEIAKDAPEPVLVIDGQGRKVKV